MPTIPAPLAYSSCRSFLADATRCLVEMPLRNLGYLHAGRIVGAHGLPTRVILERVDVSFRELALLAFTPDKPRRRDGAGLPRQQ